MSDMKKELKKKKKNGLGKKGEERRKWEDER